MQDHVPVVILHHIACNQVTRLFASPLQTTSLLLLRLCKGVRGTKWAPGSIILNGINSNENFYIEDTWLKLDSEGQTYKPALKRAKMSTVSLSVTFVGSEEASIRFLQVRDGNYSWVKADRLDIPWIDDLRCRRCRFSSQRVIDCPGISIGRGE